MSRFMGPDVPVGEPHVLDRGRGRTRAGSRRGGDEVLVDAVHQEQRLSVVQLWSALILPGFFSEFAGVDLRGEEAASRYVDRLLEGVMREEGRGKREE
jgi:hypothetical protein